MKFVRFLVPVLLLFAFACKKDKNKIKACGVDNPVENLAWLKKAVDSMNTRKMPGDIGLLTFEGQDYFNIQPLLMSCYACYIYRCDGTQLVHPADSALMRRIRMDSPDHFKVIARFGY